MLQDMQEHQAKLTEGQKKLKTLSEQYMQAVNKTPPPPDLEVNDPELAHSYGSGDLRHELGHRIDS